MCEQWQRPEGCVAARRERFDGPRGWMGWREFVDASFPRLEFGRNEHADFRAEIEILDLPAGALATMRTGAHAVTRTRALIERAEEGHIKLMWRLGGDVLVEQDGRSTRLGERTASVCDTARPYRLHLSADARISVLTLPYRCCTGWERISSKVCALALPAATSRAALAALSSLRDDLVAAECDGQSDDVLSAIHMMLYSALHGVAEGEGGGRIAQRLGRARRYISEHAADPELGPDALATALCMSRRSLYQMFSAHGLTPARLILDTRLERCRAALLDPAHINRSVTEIAFGCGFADVSSFCRLYKRRFGVSPRASRSLGAES